MTPIAPDNGSPAVILAATAVTWFGGVWGWLGANHSTIATICCAITTTICVLTYRRNKKSEK